MTLPTDGTSVDIICEGTGVGNSCLSLVISAASANTLGLDVTKLQSRVETNGSAYDGLVISGKFKIKNTEYDPALSNEASKIMHYGEITEFEFKDLEVEALRGGVTQNGVYTRVVLEAKPANFVEAIVSGTVKKLDEGKISGDETEAVTFTEADFVTLTAEQEAELVGGYDRLSGGEPTGYDFVAVSNKGYDISLSAYAGEDYSEGVSVESGIFPEGTLFFSANAMGSTNGTVANLTFTGNLATGHYMAGSFIAPATETYTAFGLRTVYKSGANQNRGAAANINGVAFKFDKYSVDTKEEWMGAPSWMWDAASGTVELKKGDVLIVEQYKYDTYDRLSAIALVPTEYVDTINQTVGWEYAAANIPTQANLDFLYEATTTPLVLPDPVNATIKVNGTNYDVSSIDADSILTVSYTDFDGEIVDNVTVADALVKAGVITSSNKSTYNAVINVKLNGTTITNYDKWTLYGGEEITATFPETVDVTNFSPVKMSDILSIHGSSDGGMKTCFTTTSSLKTSALSFVHNGSDYVDDALKDAKVSGYAVVKADFEKTYTDSSLAGVTVTIPKGSRVYFDGAYYDGTVIRSGTHGVQMYGVTYANQGSTPLHVTLPDGTVINHPYRIQQEGYDFSNVWITNSSTTSELKSRYIAEDNKWQLYTDGGKHVFVATYKVDENGKFVSISSAEDVYVTVGKPYFLTLKDDEKAIVWGYTPYTGAGTGGTTMVPMTEVLVNPVE
ncbi:MAG: hypothetical protein IJE10_07550 [Clostridia bacterium]|nr:hypothetical protein [Clostridia bacterium]